MTAPRISALDGFRALAVVAVVLFHFFSRWTPPLSGSNLYPYGSTYADYPVFRYGFLGVEFFFVISGFVISLTLATSKGPVDFFFKRISRLWPAMALCSGLTFVVLTCVPHSPFPAPARNLVPGLLFLDPYLAGKIFTTRFDWMDGAYWSLFVEVRFYIWAALVFFLARTKFLELFAGLAAVLVLLLFAAEFYVPRLRNLLDLFFFPAYLPWFTMGIAFFYLYAGTGVQARAHAAIAGSACARALLIGCTRNPAAPPQSSIGIQLAVLLAIVAAFYTFVYKPRWVSAFSWRPVTTVGAASYSLYLLHQYAGLTLLHYLTERLGAPGEMVAVFVMLLLMGVSILIYEYWEVPARQLLRRLLLPAAERSHPPGARSRLVLRSTGVPPR